MSRYKAPSAWLLINIFMPMQLPATHCTAIVSDLYQLYLMGSQQSSRRLSTAAKSQLTNAPLQT